MSLLVQALARCDCKCEKCGYDGKSNDQTWAYVPIKEDGVLNVDEGYVAGKDGDRWIFKYDVDQNLKIMCPICVDAWRKEKGDGEHGFKK